MAAPATFGQSVLNAQLDAIQNNAVTVGLCKNYARADDFATVQGKVIAQATIHSGHAIWGTRSPDFSGGTDDADAHSLRQALTAIELAAATGTANGSSDDLSLVLMSGSEVLAVTDETSDRAVSVNDVITTFAYYIQSTQPSTV